MTKVVEGQFLQAVGHVIQMQVQLAIVPLLKKIESLESDLREIKEKKVLNEDFLQGYVQQHIEIQIASLPKPKDGMDGEHGKDGKDAVIDYDMIGDVIALGIETEIKKFSIVDGKDGKDGKDGAPGKDADMESLFAYIENYMKAIPVPQNGKDGKDGKDGTAGRDGADVVGAFRDSDRHLVLTLSNGVTKDIGLIHGQDGKDGAAGKDGRDGVAYDQISFQQDEDDPRQVNVIHAGINGSHIGSFRIPGFIDKGVWRQGDYKTGDSVSVGGSMFLAQTDTDAKPETNKDWRLAVKHGREGKDGAAGPQGERGPAGHHGRDLTQLGADGSKWR